MNTLSTKHPIALTAASLGTAPYYLNGYIEACIEEKFPVYVDDSLNEASLATLERAVEKWSTYAAIEIIRGEAALIQSNIETLLDLGTPLTFKEGLPIGFRGNVGMLIERDSQVTSPLKALLKDGRAFILSSKRWDEHSSEHAHFWKKSFFLPPAWNQKDVQKIKEARTQATGTDTLLIYNALEWLQSSNRETLVNSIEKTTRCMKMDSAACDSDTYISLLSRSNKVILETQDPAQLNGWLQLCSDLQIPCQPMHGTKRLSPMRKIAYGISLKETAAFNNSIREALSPTIKLLKEGTASLDIDRDQMHQASQELRAKHIIETLQLWMLSSESIKAEGSKFLLYTLPQERALHINPTAWSENEICEQQKWPTERFEQPQQIEEGFLLLKNHTHWLKGNDHRGYAIMRHCMNALLFREPNATWLHDFHAIWSQWDDSFMSTCESAVEAFYATSPKNKNGYTHIAHGILAGLRLNDDAAALLPKAIELIQKDKDLNRYERITPHEEVLYLAFSGNIEQAEALLAGAYREHKQAFDGYKVLGQWARSYGTRDQALTYYQKEKAEGRRSQECALQHALLRSEQEPLEAAAIELEAAQLRSLSDEASFIELVGRYMQMRFASMGNVAKLSDEKNNWSYIATRLKSSETRRGQSICALAQGLSEGPASGESAFSTSNTHPMHHYYWALMHAAYGNWEHTKKHLQELKGSISPDLPIQVWASAQGLLSSEERCAQNKEAVIQAVELLEASLINHKARKPSQYLLLAKLNLFLGKKDASTLAMHSFGTLGASGWRSQCSALLSWAGFRQEGQAFLRQETCTQGASNHNCFYQILAYALLGNKEKTQKTLATLKLQNPEYFSEQSAFRPNISFCEMAIAEVLEDTAWKERAKERSQNTDPFFEEKLKTWNKIQDKQLAPT